MNKIYPETLSGFSSFERSLGFPHLVILDITSSTPINFVAARSCRNLMYWSRSIFKVFCFLKERAVSVVVIFDPSIIPAALNHSSLWARLMNFPEEFTSPSIAKASKASPKLSKVSWLIAVIESAIKSKFFYRTSLRTIKQTNRKLEFNLNLEKIELI